MRQNDTNAERNKVINGASSRTGAAAGQKNGKKNSDAFHPAAVKNAKAADKARQNDFSSPRPISDELKKPSPLQTKSEAKNESVEKKGRNGDYHIPSPFTGLLLAIIIIIALVSLIAMISQSTKIERISIESEDVGYNEEILKICESLAGKSYIGLNSAEVEKAILALSPLISDCKLSGKFPRALTVSIVYEKPTYYTCTEDTFYALSAELKILGKGNLEEIDLSSVDSLIKLYLPSFKTQEIGKKIEFSVGEGYIFKLCEKLSEYEGLGKISSADLRNTQNISFIFEGSFRCDLGSSDDIDVKLTAAENIFENRLQSLINSGRTAVINVSNPNSASVRTDVSLEKEE